MSEPGEIDTYLAGVQAGMREALQALREVIAAAAPEAVEGMSYGVPAFRLKKRPVVSFGAARHHCALYVMSPAVMDAFAADLAGFDTSKGAIRFTPDAPIPVELVTKLVHARVAELTAPTSARPKAATE